jgi:hypothetical protein
MSSDFSRQRFNPAKNFSSVLMQQGRVQLDADWNEGKEILDRHWRSATIDIIGRGVVPRETPNGFEAAISGGMLTIGRGRIYVDGLQAENHGADEVEFDPVLAEVRGVNPVRYDAQPYLPNAPALPESGGPHLVYLDVWQREVTAIEDPTLLESAVGVDTTSRLQTVWQVRVLANLRGVTCATPDENVPGWLDLIRPSAGRLTTAAVGVATTEDPCLVPPSGGYRGLENRLYRVEIHDAGPEGEATFKWSRDNASLATNVSRIQSETTLTVDRAVWDSIRRFNPGDWVEISDDWREFSGLPGEIRRIASVVDASRTITLDAPLTAGLFPVYGPNLTYTARHTRIKRWDQAGIVRDTAGAAYHDLDAPGGTGLIPVPPPGTSLILEDGVEVTFTTAPADGEFRSADYWVFAARTADASVEILEEAPPRGVHHHFCRLAVITFPNTVVDCRTFWPPVAAAGESCDCTVCVSAEEHNGGTHTLYQAVDEIRKSGGTICLGPGTFNLVQRPVDLDGAFSIRIRGQGAATVLVQPRGDAAFIYRRSQWCTLENLTIHTITAAINAPAIRIHTSFGTTFERLIIAPPAEGEGPLAALWIEPGLLMLTRFRDNVVRAQNGIAFAFKDESGPGGTDDTPLFLGNLHVERNLLRCGKSAVRIGGAAFHFGDIVIARNSIELTSVAGITFTAVGLLEVDINENVIGFEKGDGIVCGGGPARITGNELLSREHTGDRGIRMVASQLKAGLPAFLVSENRLQGLRGSGISIETRVGSAKLERNLLGNLLGNGIVMSDGGVADVVSVLGNELLNIASASAVETRARQLAAIHLARVGEGIVSDNLINGVGRDAAVATVIAGIRIDGSRDVRVSDNTVTDIAPRANFANLAAGVLVLGPLVTIEISDNLIRRQITFVDVDTSDWQAVRIFGLASAGGIRQQFAGFSELTVAQRIQAINSFAAAAQSGVEEAGLTANSMHGYGGAAVVQVVVTGGCRFTDNHCSAGTRPIPIAVDLTGTSIVASANRVECERATHALDLKVNKNTFTVLGNITGGPIFVQGAVLGGVWQPLNVTP